VNPQVPCGVPSVFQAEFSGISFSGVLAGDGEMPTSDQPRRFQPPWSIDDPDMKLGQDCYIVRDANGHALAYVYFEDEPGRRSAAHLMTREEARRIAANIAELPIAAEAA
jgi:hypothetical protein